MQPKEFIEMVKYPAIEIEQEHGIPAAVIIAQAALETGWLRHEIRDKHTGEKSYNLFGIKAHGGWEGDTVTIDTHEYKDGRRLKKEDEFRAYNSFQESILDHMQFLFDNPRYEKTLEASNPIEFARRLQAAGYATDPKYAEKLISIMRKYDLLEIKAMPEVDYKDHWAKDYINRGMDRGMFSETDEFRPEDPLTRAEAAVIVDRLIKFITSTERKI